MIELTRWLDRTFPVQLPVGLFPVVVERLRGTPLRLAEKVAGHSREILTARPQGAWSLQEHAGHLVDLESLWAGRLDDFLAGAAELRPADLTNQATYEADHNAASIERIVGHFGSLRVALVDRLDGLSADDVSRQARHPRLGHPMRVIDLCCFVCDHDDHHLAIMTDLVRSFRAV